MYRKVKTETPYTAISDGWNGSNGLSKNPKGIGEVMKKNLQNTINAMVINATNVMDDVTIVANDVMVNGEKVADLNEFMTNPEICDYAREVSKQVYADFQLNGKTNRILKVENKGLGSRKLTLQIGKTEHEYIECLNADGSHWSLSSAGLSITSTAEELLIGELDFGDYGDILVFKTYNEEEVLLVWNKEYDGHEFKCDAEDAIYSRSFAKFNRTYNEFEWFDEDILSIGDYDTDKQYIEDGARSFAEQIGK